jgi:hypothetical protein
LRARVVVKVVALHACANALAPSARQSMHVCAKFILHCID